MFVFSLIDRVVLRSLMPKGISAQNTPCSNVVTREGCVLPSASMRFPVDAEQLPPHVPCGRAGLMRKLRAMTSPSCVVVEEMGLHLVRQQSTEIIRLLCIGVYVRRRAAPDSPPLAGRVGAA